MCIYIKKTNIFVAERCGDNGRVKVKLTLNTLSELSHERS